MTKKQINNWLGSDSTGGLCLWQAWNDAVNSGQKAIETPTGKQFLIIEEGLVMESKKGTHGWDTDIYTESQWEKHIEDEDTLAWKLAAPRVLE